MSAARHLLKTHQERLNTLTKHLDGRGRIRRQRDSAQSAQMFFCVHLRYRGQKINAALMSRVLPRH